MILHPGILALLVGSTLVLGLAARAAWTGLQVVAYWDFDSSSERQLALERRTALVSSLTAHALGFHVLAAVLFVYTLDDLHQLFDGAMCATGTLNANPVGWTALGLKLVVAVLAALWIVVNRMDERAGDFPLVRAKYLALVGLVPLLAGDLFLQLRYFGGLDPEIVTSCCGSLFGAGGAGVAAEIAALPVAPTMVAFYGAIAVFLATGLACLVSPSRMLRGTLSVLALLVLVVGLAGTVAFVSLYVYQLPTHHCPFDMLQAQHGFVGFALYASLFAGVYFGLLPGVVQPLRRTPSLAAGVAAADRRWLVRSIWATALFAAVATWPVAFGELSLFGH